MIIGHISGPSGSGKTYLGKKISKKFKNIIYIDFDDINDEFKEKYKDVTTNIENLANQFLKEYLKPYKNKYILLAGYHGIIHKRNDSWNNKPLFYKFDTNHRYYIDLDTEIILKQRFIVI